MFLILEEKTLILFLLEFIQTDLLQIMCLKVWKNIQNIKLMDVVFQLIRKLKNLVFI